MNGFVINDMSCYYKKMVIRRNFLIILLLAVFVAASMASSVMASCENASDLISIEEAMDIPMETTMNGDHTASGAHEGHEQSPLNCYDCDSSLCQTQSLLPELTAHNFVGHFDTIHIDKDIKLKTIFLTKIPEPPKQIS